MTHGKENGSGLTARQIVWILTSLAAMLAVVVTLHASVVVPSILHSVDKEIDRKITGHSNQTHASAVSRNEFQLILDKLNRIEIEIRELRKR